MQGSDLLQTGGGSGDGGGGAEGVAAEGHAAHIGKFAGAGPDVRLIQRALSLLGGDGGGEVVEVKKAATTTTTRWKGHKMST